ncbi:MAG: hypothetical protein IPL89_04290 [Acidobacteria bacterium]|nr:hypothetical protein [Acidobacteriota bacterium]
MKRDDVPSPVRAPGARGAFADFAVCCLAATAWAAFALPRVLTHLRDGYDAPLQAWQLAWVRHALNGAGTSLFDANIFAPARNTLAFTEPLVGYGVAGVPLAAAGLPVVGVFNVLCLLGIAFSVWATARLAVAYGSPRLPALLGAAAAGLGAETACGFGYVSFVAAGGIPLALLAWKSVREKGRPAAVLALGASLGGLGWFSLHLFAFALVALGGVVLLDLLTGRSARRPAALGKLASALALALVLLLPLAVHMIEARRDNDFRRSDAEAALFSAAPADWLATTDSNPGQAFLTRRSGSEKALYPGTASLALGALAIVALLWRRRPSGLVSTGVVLVAVSFAGSLGPGGPLIPALKALAPPLFGGIRAFARFGAVSQVGFGLLAAAGCSILLERLASPAGRAAAALALGAGIAVDVRQTVRFGFRPEVPAPPVEEFLTRIETGGPILHLPLFHSPSDARWVFASLAHFKPIVNGNASYVPRRNVEFAEALAVAPIPESLLDTLAAWPTGVVVVHEHALPLRRLAPTLDFMEAGMRAGIFDSPKRLDHAGGDDWIFFVRRGPGPAAAGDTESFRRHAAAAPRVPSSEDHGFPASIDVPAEGAVVRGALDVTGWSQTPEGPGEIVEFRVDQDRRSPSAFTRTPRRDVAAAIPGLGSCGTAGYEARLAPLPGDAASHVLRVVFRAPDGRVRTLERAFEWLP